jgi:hypothetical protein
VWEFIVFLFFSKVEGEKRVGWIGEFICDGGGVKIYVDVGNVRFFLGIKFLLVDMLFVLCYF